MSISVNSNELLKADPGPKRAREEHLNRNEKAKETEDAKNVEGKSGQKPKHGPTAPNVDEYVHGEEPASPGLYRPVRDEDGNRNVHFDEPKEMDSQENALQPSGHKKAEEAPDKAKGDGEGEKQYRVSTDKVDAEIRDIKQKRTKLEQQLAQASQDPDKAAKIQEELSRIDQELQMKDNDTYRRQNAEGSYVS